VPWRARKPNWLALRRSIKQETIRPGQCVHRHQNRLVHHLVGNWGHQLQLVPVGTLSSLGYSFKLQSGHVSSLCHQFLQLWWFATS
jgi:hypothetical protein